VEDLALAGKSSNEISERLSIPVNAIYHMRKQLGIKSKHWRAQPRNQRDPSMVSWVVELYRAGVPVEEIVSETGLTASTMYRYLRAGGVEPARRVGTNDE